MRVSSSEDVGLHFITPDLKVTFLSKQIRLAHPLVPPKICLSKHTSASECPACELAAGALSLQALFYVENSKDLPGFIALPFQPKAYLKNT